jgi:hypothetical protein
VRPKKTKRVEIQHQQSTSHAPHRFEGKRRSNENEVPFGAHLTDARTCPSRDLPPRITWRRAQDRHHIWDAHSGRLIRQVAASTAPEGEGGGREGTREQDGLPGRRSGSVGGVGQFARCRVDVGTRRDRWQVRQLRERQLVGEVQGRGLDCWLWRTSLSGYVGVRFSEWSYLGDRNQLGRR